MLLANNFSLGMLEFPKGDLPTVQLWVRKLDIEEVKVHVLKSVVEHQDTANLLSGLLGMEVAYNRTTVKVSPGEDIIVGQYIGPRLPEGTTTLPEGAKIEFFLVQVCPAS